MQNNQLELILYIWLDISISYDANSRCKSVFYIYFISKLFLFWGRGLCRCGGRWVALFRPRSCRRVMPTSKGSKQRSGCSVMWSTQSRWVTFWRTSCSCMERSASRSTDAGASSAYRAKMHQPVNSHFQWKWNVFFFKLYSIFWFLYY